MKILILCPGSIPKDQDEINSFYSLCNYYIPRSLKKISTCDTLAIPEPEEIFHEDIKRIFETYNFDDYDSIISLGLRYFSKIPANITSILRERYKGIICQYYDGARIKKDPVDITFTMKNDFLSRWIKYWYIINKGKNVHIGWGADPILNYPNQEPNELRILVDHPNYALNNSVDKSSEILDSINKLHKSSLWKNKYKSLKVRRFTSNEVVDHDFNNTEKGKYIPSKIPYTKICEEHGKSHIFLVTHPESLGLAVLETALAGALVVTPKGFISSDRLKTIRHYEYNKNINWEKVMDMIDIDESRSTAIKNNWDNVAKNIVDGLNKFVT